MLVHLQKDELEAEVKEEVEHAREDLDEGLQKQVPRTASICCSGPQQHAPRERLGRRLQGQMSSLQSCGMHAVKLSSRRGARVKGHTDRGSVVPSHEPHVVFLLTRRGRRCARRYRMQ
jgi:hypothetical protein